MQTALEPFMQPGVQETKKKNILLSTLLSLCEGKRREGFEKNAARKKSRRSDVLSRRTAISALELLRSDRTQ